jgi:hypothetical protein
MKLLKAVIVFFTDDLTTAAMVIAWIAIAAILNRETHLGLSGALIYLIGMIAILIFGAWRRTKSG